MIASCDRPLTARSDVRYFMCGHCRIIVCICCWQELEKFLPQRQPQVNEAETGLAYQDRRDYSLL